MARAESQRKQILKHLRTGKSITPIEALQLYGCFRLSAVIFDIKNKDNVNVYTELVVENAGKRYAKYYIV